MIFECYVSITVLLLFQGVVGTPDSCKTSLIRAFHEGVVEIGDDEPSRFWVNKYGFTFTDLFS